MKLKKPNVHTWAVSNPLDPTKGKLICDYCHAEKEYKLPMDIDLWVLMTRKFDAEHENCKPTETGRT